MNIGKVLVEVDVVLSYVPKKDLEKIPEEIRKSIKENKDKNYIWKYDESKSLKEQNLSKDSLALLAYLNTEYMLNPEQKKLMNKIYRFNEIALEKEKKKRFKSSSNT